MALKPVTDPNLLTALNTAPAPNPATVPGPKPVTDPAVLAQLNAPAPEPTVAPDGGPLFGNDVPVVDMNAPAPQPQPEPSIWEKFLNTAGLDQPDPKLEFFGDAAKTIALGAPEALLDIGVNTAAQGVAGLTAPFVAPDVNDATGYIQDFTENNSRTPYGDSAAALEAGLGEAFAPLGNIKRKLGETALNVTGSPAVATAADMLPDLGLTMLGGSKAAQGASDLVQRPPKPAPEVNPKVADLRAADIRLRPSDVRAMTPGAKKVPGEFREKFADAPGMKKDMTLHNQQKLTDAAAKEIGVKTLDEASLAKAKETPAATYDMVEQVLMDQPMSPGFIDTFREAAASAKLPKGEQSSVTRVIGALRRRAAKRMQNDQVATEEAGFADRELADRLEEALGKELDAIGEPQLIDDYRAARQQFAKIHDVETATRAGQIDASALYKLKKRGVPLTGGLALAADAAEFAPNVTQHSLKTAARAGDEIESSREGLIKRGVKAAVRKIPGMDVGSEGFQRSLGAPDPLGARTSYAGQPPYKAPPPRAPEQADMLGDAFDLEQPPGAVGAPPQRAPRPLGSQTDMLGEAFEFDRPPGEVGIPPEAQISLQELLGLGEPLAMKQPPGRVGKPKRKE